MLIKFEVTKDHIYIIQDNNGPKNVIRLNNNKFDIHNLYESLLYINNNSKGKNNEH